MRGNIILSQFSDQNLFQLETNEEGFDYNLLVEELSYWAYVTNDRKASPSLKEYAANQIILLQAHLNQTNRLEQLKKSG